MQGLSERGVIVRAGAALGEEGRLRVTYGTRQENDRFLAALDEAAVASIRDGSRSHVAQHPQRPRAASLLVLAI